MIVNSTWQTILETVEHLYQATENHLRYIPYEKGSVYDDIKTAITPGELQCVPEFIEKTININNRCINVYTFLKIMNKLELEDNVFQKNLMAYSDDLADINSSIDKQYKELFLESLILENITKKSNEGIIVTNNNFLILYSNEKAKEILRFDNETKNLQDILKTSGIDLEQPIDNMLIEIFGIAVLINKISITYNQKSEDYYFNLKEEIYIKNLGNALNDELKKRGFMAKYSFKDIVHCSEKMNQIINFAKKISLPDYSVLITGETGTGKEVFAQAIHNASPRMYGPFIAINGAALPETYYSFAE